MSTESGGEAAEVVTTTAAPEAAVSSQESGKTAERDYEAEAAEQGWRPQEEWTGKPENWKDAKTFVEYGEVNNRVFKVEKDYAERFKKLEAVTSKTIARLQAAHEKEMAALKAERREAIKTGNIEEVERIDGELEELRDAAPANREDAGTNSIPVAGSPEHVKLIRDFNRANPWMIEEPDMAEYAERFSERNAAMNDGITFAENMRATEAAVRKKFPNYFANTKTAANGHAAVDLGGSFPGAPLKAGKGFADLPAEAKRAWENFDPKVKKELPKEKYAKEYFDA